MTRRIVLATLGSLGDLHPFIALARALQGPGYQVTLAAAAEYRDKVMSAGVPFQAMRPSFAQMEHDLGMSRAELTRHMVADSRFLFRRLVLPYLRQSYDDMMQICADADLVLTSSLAYGARLAAEKRALPWSGVVLQPMMFLSAYDPPLVLRAAWVTRLLRACGPAPTAMVLRAGKRAVRRMFAPLDEVRCAIGLGPSALDPMFESQFSALGTIALYSGLLGAVQPDYPPRTVIAGFATFDSLDGAKAGLEPALEEFLRAGPAPLVFTLGSLIVTDPGSFYRESLAAARRLRMRAVLLIGDSPADDRTPRADTDVFVGAYAPHSLLFARAAAIVHQGGIGTLAQALRSGRVELIVPFFADQIDNADRAVRLGVARVLAPRRYRAARVATALRALLQNRDCQRAADSVRSRLLGEDGAALAARAIRECLERRHPGSC